MLLPERLRKAESWDERAVAGDMAGGVVGKRREEGVPGRLVWEEVSREEEVVRMWRAVRRVGGKGA